MNPNPQPAAFVALVATGCAWAISPVFMRMMTPHHDPYTIMLVRYLMAGIPLIPITLIFYRTDLMRVLRMPRAMLGLVALNIAQQYVWTNACYGATATSAQLVTKLSVIFVIVLSFVFFREERSVIKHPLFVGGTAVSFLGVAVVLMKDPGSAVPVFDRYAVLLMLTALFWAFYSVSAKHIVTDIHPIPVFTVLLVGSTSAFIPMAFVWGEPATLFDADLRLVVVYACSGIIPLSLGHPTFYFAQKHLGASFCSTFNLFTPVLTFVLALVLLPNEKLLAMQLLGGGILISGTVIVTIARRRVQRITLVDAME